MTDDCVFCKIVNGELPSTKIYENDSFVAILNINPIAEGHSLVISKKHFDNILDMPNSLGHELLDCIKKTALKLIDEKKAEGFSIVNNNFRVAGQMINHIHFHILPRTKDDDIKMIA